MWLIRDPTTISDGTCDESRERRLDSAFGRIAQGSNEIARRGRSSGAVIYLWLSNAQRFVLFMLYTKAKQTDIPPAILVRLRMAVETIKAKYNR